MMLEFIVVHSSVFTGLFAFSDFSRSRRALGVLVISAFYVLFAAAFSAAFETSWPVLAFFGLTLNRMLGAFLGPAPSGNGRQLVLLTWVASTASYVLLAALTVMVEVPALGVTPDVVQAQHFNGSGEWLEEPQHALAFGFLYFLVQGFVSLYARDLVGRTERQPSASAVS
jgi:hypothetical protein